MAEFQVDTVKLRECGTDIVNLSKEFSEIMDSMFSRINNVPIATKEWTGEAATTYVKKLNLEKKYYNMFRDNLCEYGRLLISASEKFDGSVKDLLL